MSKNDDLKLPREPKFPTHNAPRVWFLTCANSPVGISLSRHLLAHGDYVTAGVLPVEFEKHEDRSADFKEFLNEVGTHQDKETWRARLRVVALDVRIMAQCQSAVAEAVQSFGRVDIKAALPSFRSKKNGHIILLTAITGHLGTPGLSMYCASQWAIEGYCDSLAYEIAPFNIKLSIVQPNMEINVLTHKITSAPPMSAYAEETNPAPLSRNILSGLLDRLEGSSEPTIGDQLHSNEVKSLYPPLSKAMKERLVAETVHAVAAIGGHDNPPARHIVGFEGVTTVKEKLKTVSEELEDFIECSISVDIEKSEEAPRPLSQGSQTHFILPG
ncbi:hypothetical protein LTR82_011843 [Friedmanniomyces endolithicus]|uniref:NAD(P)-binding protein n=1 Tax=Friedmanniomyces endolithicus TaxID=329885 RepID=A0AAN6J5I9_9PEZI|nr:hypothetical protein LTR82_011843 [Friedmanniomyces endolithicus]